MGVIPLRAEDEVWQRRILLYHSGLSIEGVVLIIEGWIDLAVDIAVKLGFVEAGVVVSREGGMEMEA